MIIIFFHENKNIDHQEDYFKKLDMMRNMMWIINHKQINAWPQMMLVLHTTDRCGQLRMHRVCIQKTKDGLTESFVNKWFWSDAPHVFHISVQFNKGTPNANTNQASSQRSVYFNAKHLHSRGICKYLMA